MGHLVALTPAILALADRGWIKMSTVVWPAGLDIRLITELRGADAASARVLEAIEGQPTAGGVTASDILAVHGFHRQRSRRFVVDLAQYLIAAASAEGVGPDPGEDRAKSAAAPRQTPSAQVSSTPPASPATERELSHNKETVPSPSSRPVAPADDDSVTAWERAKKVLQPLLAMAVQFERVSTLRDVLDPELRKLASALDQSEELDSIQVRDLLGAEPSPAARIASDVKTFLRELTPAEMQVVELRLLREDLTLDAVGRRLAVTRERVRQLQVRLERRLDSAPGTVAREVAAVLRPTLGPVCTPEEVEAALTPLLTTLDGRAKRLARYVLLPSLDYPLVHGLYMDTKGRRIFDSLRVKIRDLADDAGLISKSEIWPHVPPELKRVWPRLRDAYGFALIGRHWALRVTQRAKVKAALLAIGEPAPASDVAERAEVTKRQAATVLANLPSVVKADRTRWGIRDWVAEPYEGIAEQIVKRIKDGGGWADKETLERELPEKFGVTAGSVRQYLRTDRFTVRSGRVTLTDANTLHLRPLDAVVARDRTGAPYWEFQVEGRYLEGYSVTGLPAELAHHLECPPDSGIRVPLTSPPGVKPLSIRWPLASTTGLSLGYVKEPLHELGAKPGDRARVVFRGGGAAEMTLMKNARRDPQPESRPAESAEDILEAMRRRRQAW